MARADRATWARRVQNWRASRLSAAAYAAKIGVHPKTLAYWRWRIESGRDHVRRGQAQVVRARSASAAPVVTLARTREAAPASLGLSFVELPGERDPLGNEPFEIVLVRGDRIRVPAAFDAVSLARLLEVLERRP